jgi:hypothetical protein
MVYDNPVFQRLLFQRVGGFFRNTVHDPGRTCAVCCGPTSGGELCSRCVGHREFGARLADHVFILTYVRGVAESRGHPPIGTHSAGLQAVASSSEVRR